MKIRPDQPRVTPLVTAAIAFAQWELKFKQNAGKLSPQPGLLQERVDLALMCMRSASGEDGREPSGNVLQMACKWLDPSTVDAAFKDNFERRAGFHLLPPRLVEYDDELARPVIAMANRGDAYALDVLRAFARWFLEKGKPVPSNLRSHIIDVYEGRASTTTTSRIKKFEQRDFEIGLMVAKLVAMDFTATAKRSPNRSRPSASACWIVMRALGNIGIHTSAPLVEKAWQKYPADVWEKIRQNETWDTEVDLMLLRSDGESPVRKFFLHLRTSR